MHLVGDLTPNAHLIEQVISGSNETKSIATPLKTDAIEFITQLLKDEDNSIRLKAAELVLKFKL